MKAKLYVYHPGMGTSMAFTECVIMPVPDAVSAKGGDEIDAYFEAKIEELNNDIEQGVFDGE